MTCVSTAKLFQLIIHRQYSLYTFIWRFAILLGFMRSGIIVIMPVVMSVSTYKLHISHNFEKLDKRTRPSQFWRVLSCLKQTLTFIYANAFPTCLKPFATQQPRTCSGNYAGCELQLLLQVPKLWPPPTYDSFPKSFSPPPRRREPPLGRSPLLRNPKQQWLPATPLRARRRRWPGRLLQRVAFSGPSEDSRA